MEASSSQQYTIGFPPDAFNANSQNLIESENTPGGLLGNNIIAGMIASTHETIGIDLKSETSVKFHACLCIPWKSFSVECIKEKGEKHEVICFEPLRFQNLREIFGLSQSDFIGSLKQCEKFTPEGGKSNSVFFKTKDQNFILKSLQRVEFEKLLGIVKDYVEHVEEALKSENPLLLSRIVGLYKVTIKGDESFNGFVMVMQNTIPNPQHDFLYDIKGTVLGRDIPESKSKDAKILFDGNFIAKKLFVDAASKLLFTASLTRDTKFLAENGLMDYSILVGVYANQKVMMCSLIDFLRPYSCDKRVENAYKTMLRCKIPTVIDPKCYRTRMIEFMEQNLKVEPEDIETETSIELD